MSDEYSGSYGMRPLSHKRSGKMAKVGDRDYSGMTEEQVRASRVARIRDIFAGLRGKAEKPAKPAGSQPRASGGEVAKGDEFEGFTEYPPAFGVELPPMPAAAQPQRIAPDFMQRPGFARGIADAAAMHAFAQDPSMGPEGLNFLHSMVETGMPALAGIEGAPAIRMPTLADAGAIGQALGIAAQSPHGAGMVRPEALTQSAVQAAAPYLPALLRMVTAPGSISSDVSGAVGSVVGGMGDGYHNVMDVLAKMYRGQ